MFTVCMLVLLDAQELLHIKFTVTRFSLKSYSCPCINKQFTQ
jgi:hypothetical protein